MTTFIRDLGRNDVLSLNDQLYVKKLKKIRRGAVRTVAGISMTGVVAATSMSMSNNHAHLESAPKTVQTHHTPKVSTEPKNVKKFPFSTVQPLDEPVAGAAEVSEPFAKSVENIAIRPISMKKVDNIETAGVVKTANGDVLNPYVTYRTTDASAYAPQKGVISDVKGDEVVIKSQKDHEIYHYILKGVENTLKVGDKVKEGDKLGFVKSELKFAVAMKGNNGVYTDYVHPNVFVDTDGSDSYRYGSYEYYSKEPVKVATELKGTKIESALNHASDEIKNSDALKGTVIKSDEDTSIMKADKSFYINGVLPSQLIEGGTATVSSSVRKKEPLVKKIASKDGMEKYTEAILAVAEVEKDRGNDILTEQGIGETLQKLESAFAVMDMKDPIKHGDVRFVLQMLNSGMDLGNAAQSEEVNYNVAYVQKQLGEQTISMPVTEHSIMGKSVVSASKLAAFAKSVNPDAQDVDEIADAFISMGDKYGIRGDIAFCQSLIETGFFKFDGGTEVTSDQHNYAGIGVTHKGLKGNSFDTVQEGVEAQLQHLFAYSTNQPLPDGNVLDPRFDKVTRGSATTWESLNNRWAMNDHYGQDISNLYNKLASFADVSSADAEVKTESGVDPFYSAKVFEYFTPDHDWNERAKKAETAQREKIDSEKKKAAVKPIVQKEAPAVAEEKTVEKKMAAPEPVQPIPADKTYTTPTVSAPPESDALKGKVIVLDAGHGGHDPGSRGADGTNEADLNLSTALKAEKALEDQGAKVIMTRKTKEGFMSPTDRGIFADKEHADILVSIHANSSASPSGTGAETEYEANNDLSKSLAANIQGYVAKAMNMIPNRGLTQRGATLDSSLGIFRASDTPGALIEPGFVTGDLSELKSEVIQQSIANAVTKGVLDYFANLPKKEVAEVKPAPPEQPKEEIKEDGS